MQSGNRGSRVGFTNRLGRLKFRASKKLRAKSFSLQFFIVYKLRIGVKQFHYSPRMTLAVTSKPRMAFMAHEDVMVFMQKDDCALFPLLA